MKKQKIKEEKKIIKNPRFMVIGLIAVIVVIGLIYTIFLKYSPIMNFKYEGYAVSGKEITENLLGSLEDTENNAEANRNIELAKIEEQGRIFKKLSKYFVGNKEKTEINLNYPIYINGNSSIYNLSEESVLISKDFERIAGYPNLSIAEGKVYDGNSLERTDGKEYIFIETADKIYINLQEIKIETTANEYIIPSNSIIGFTEKEVRYYSVKNNVLVFNQIKDVDENTRVEIVENNYTYEEILTKLGIIGKQEGNTEQKEETEENIIKEDTSSKETTEQAEQLEEEKEETSEDQINEGEVYIKPEVSVEEFTAEVYTAKSVLHIQDPAGKIIEAPTFEIYKNGKIYLRRTYTSSGNITVTGLEPGTEYEIKGKYVYENEEEKKVENTFYTGKIETKGYDSLGTIKIEKENGEIYSDRIQIKNLKITSDLQSEVIRGINKIEIVAQGIKTTLKNNEVNQLLQGKEVTVESSEGLKADSKIEYEIKIYDLLGKELKVENSKGETRTAKEKPEVKVSIKEQNIVSVTLNIKLTNKNKAKIENYKYIITQPNGNKVKEEKLAENETTIVLDDLDSNQYYEIKVYADYDLEDEKGIQKEQEIGKLVFATSPLSTLGSVEMKVEGKDITTDKATIEYEIDEERTDKRLIQILEEIKIEIINKNSQVVEKTKEIREEELEKLKTGEKGTEKYEELKSNTNYEIRITSKVKTGQNEEGIQVTYTYNQFTTLRTAAKVEIQNQFVTGEMIDLDVRIEDPDKSVLNNKVRMELRDENNNLIDLEEIETNQEYKRKTYDKLEEEKKYKLSFYADEYNEGETDATYKVNYLIKEMEIITEPGISGNIGLKSMLRMTTGKNLVDVESKVKWYTNCFSTWGCYEKNYNETDNSIRLWPGLKNNSQSYTYDLRDYIGQEVTISFKLKTENDIARIAIQNNKKIGANVKDIIFENNKEYIEYQQTIIINDTGYVGFVIWNGSTEDNSYVYIKDLQIELGNKKTNYEEYKYGMKGEAILNLEDKRDEISTNDYYIKIYENNEEISTTRYADIPANNRLENAIKNVEIKENEEYKMELIVKIRDREYILSTFEFNTKEGEILGISSVEEYKDIQPEGNYIILNDLDFRNEVSNWQVKFAPNVYFQGHINFNGHTIYKRYFNGGNDALFGKIGENGRIENLVLKEYFSNDLACLGTGLFDNNYGTISNLYISIEECKKNDNTNLKLLGSNNYGNISNFILKYSEKLYATNICAIASNLGTIVNGYIYGENIQLWNISSTTYNTPFITNNFGSIKNIYSLVGIDADEIRTIDNTGLLVNGNGGGNVENVYTVGIGNTYRIDQNPNITNGLGRISNSYYINDKEFKGTADKKITEKLLYDSDFQNNVLNSDNQFEVDSLITSGYYPQLKLNDCMPRQDYNLLPEITEADLPDVLSTEIIEQENKKAKVKVNIYNPAGETIQKIIVKNLTSQIVSQNYSSGRSEVILELTNPIQCVSEYPILSLTTKGAYNIEYTRKYEEGERNIGIELYNEIYTIDDWYQIKNNGTENYRLMNDLDFKNADISLYSNINFKGILDGQRYMIKNFYVDRPLFWDCNNATIINLSIKNYNIDNTGAYVGIIAFGSYIKIKNVNIDTVNVKAIYLQNKCIGGVLGSGDYGKFENITLNNINITVENTQNMTLGGMIGIGVCDISNCIINNLKIEAKSNMNPIGIGGVIGKAINSNYDVKNIILKGNITSDSGEIGGIIGYGNITIKNCLSNINIIADGDYIGGIKGYETANPGNSQNNLYKGNILNKKETNYTGYISGNERDGTNNYIVEDSKINGLPKETSNKLQKEELQKDEIYTNILKWDDNYDYSDLNNKLPKVKNVEKTEILPNQEDIYLSKGKISLETVDTLKTDSNTLNIRISINNPDNLEITKVEIENMDTEVIDNRNEKEKTYITLTASPTKYYDSYQITNIKYKDNNEEKSEKQYYLIQEAFYREITKYEDWENINPDSYENYRLLTDLDFLGKQNINHNFKIGKLITEGNKHTIKNINLEAIENYFGLIKECKNGIENIKFENIKIDVKEDITISYVGVIAQNSGNILNVEFNNITINVTNKVSYVGCISDSTGYKIENINLAGININAANGYVGGLFGRMDSGMIHNIIADDIHIKASGSNIGGIIGTKNTKIENILENIQITNSEIDGNSAVGGIIGSGNVTKTAYVEHCNINGISNVGGISGNPAGDIYYAEVTDSKIRGTTNVGGISGTGGSVYYSKLKESLIEGTNTDSKNVGGIGGYSSNIGKSYVLNSNIISKGSNIGSILGNGINAEYNCSINNYVEGNSNVGGISGYGIVGTIRYNYTNSTVIATEHSVGGILGYLDNSEMTNISNGSCIYNNYYAGETIQSKTNVGGIIGEIATELYDKTTTNYYRQNYIEATLISEDNSTTSLGIGNMPEEISKVKDTYFYKYSNVNGKNPSKENEPYIKEEQYLEEEQLKQQTTYTNNLKWGTANFDYNILTENKYPILKYNNEILPNQEGIDIPKDEEHIIDSESNENNNNIVEEQTETIENTFEYADKEIETYSTYSIIQTRDGNSVRRDIKLYVKENKLYGIPISFVNNTGEEITPVANNLIVDSYNGKEYETILGSDGKMYDLKEEIEYPEEFENKDIESIGNNLETEEKEIEVKYKNGDIVKFNYQTGEIIKTSKTENKQNLLEYIGDKLTEIGEEKTKVESISTKYEESKELENKLEELPIEKAIQKNSIENNESRNDVSEENKESNDSEKEKKYISVYNEEKGEYQIYKEAELLDTEKEEVESENEKIEANNLKEYYAKGQESKDEKQGIVWIVISIIGVGIVLLILRKNLKKKR